MKTWNEVKKEIKSLTEEEKTKACEGCTKKCLSENCDESVIKEEKMGAK